MRRFSSAFLLALVAATAFGPAAVSADEGNENDSYIGSDLGFSLYKAIDKGAAKLQGRLIEKRLKGSGQKLNQAIGTACRDKVGNAIECLNGSDFTVADFETIRAGGLGPLVSHMKPEALDNFSTSTLSSSVLQTLNKYYDQTLADARSERRGLETFGTVGIFTDGDQENSGYDLVYDLEQINKIIFKDAPGYDGIINSNATNIGNLMSGNFGTDPLSPYIGERAVAPEDTDPATGTPTTGTSTGTSATGTTRTGTTSTGAAVSSGSLVCAPDGSFDPSTLVPTLTTTGTTATGVTGTGTSATGTTATGTTRTGTVATGVHPTLGLPGLSGYSGSRDSYSCSGKQIFCIEITFEKYEHMLLDYSGGGSSDNSIEGILDKNTKIFNKFAGSSLVQARMTNNFFELSLKDLKLPEMLHIGVVVTKRPPPILNLLAGQESGEGEEGDSKDGKDDPEGDNEFKDILTRTFAAHGLEHRRQNLLTNDCIDYQMSLLTHLSTERAGEKAPSPTCRPSNGKEEAYPQVKSGELKDDYLATLAKDTSELQKNLEGISKGIDDIIGVIKGLNEIPKSK